VWSCGIVDGTSDGLLNKLGDTINYKTLPVLINTQSEKNRSLKINPSYSLRKNPRSDPKNGLSVRVSKIASLMTCDWICGNLSLLC
jgi:hypothetical protein